jgi:hypothetical protein
MFKTSLTLTAAWLALMSVGASAQDNSSYENRGYGGPLGVGPNFHQGGQSAPPVYGSGQERSYGTERYRAPQRLDRVERRRNDADDDVKTAKKTTAPKESEEAKAQNENSSIVSIASDTGKTVPITEQKKTDVAKSDKSKFSNENSAIASVASSATAKADPVKAQVTKADTDSGAKTVGTCKRYFPTVGQTITVPCD